LFVRAENNSDPLPPQNPVELIALKAKAAQGDAEAQYLVGMAYAIGEVVPCDDVECAKWIRQAAEQGHVGAQSYLSAAYGIGSGVPHDDAEAVKWLRRAAAQGDAEAQFSLGFRETPNNVGVRDGLAAAA
jgi:hypothetical protein